MARIGTVAMGEDKNGPGLTCRTSPPHTTSTPVETVMRYHERTKHRFNRYADGPRQLDWANQPNPFRRFEGAPLVRLPLLGAREGAAFAPLR
jgi:hypothetical protein